MELVVGAFVREGCAGPQLNTYTLHAYTCIHAAEYLNDVYPRDRYFPATVQRLLKKKKVLIFDAFFFNEKSGPFLYLSLRLSFDSSQSSKAVFPRRVNFYYSKIVSLYHGN